MPGESLGTIVALAGAAGALTQLIGPAFRFLTRTRLELRKATLQEISTRQDVLTEENKRLGREVVDLRTALGVEEESHRHTRQQLERVQRQCDDCERFMRMIGQKE